jgi:hypothetical protein
VETAYKDIIQMMPTILVMLVALTVKLVLVHKLANVLYVTLVTSYMMDVVLPHAQMVSMPMKPPENVNIVTVLVKLVTILLPLIVILAQVTNTYTITLVSNHVQSVLITLKIQPKLVKTVMLDVPFVKILVSTIVTNVIIHLSYSVTLV